MFASVLGELLICWIRKFGQLFLGDSPFSIFAQLVFWNNHTVEILAVCNLESHVEDDHDYDDETGGPKVNHRSEQERPNCLINKSQKLNCSKSNNDASNRVLRRNVLGPASLLLALAKNDEYERNQGTNQIREVQNAQIIDRYQHAWRLFCIKAIIRWTFRRATTFMNVEPVNAKLCLRWVFTITKSCCTICTLDTNEICAGVFGCRSEWTLRVAISVVGKSEFVRTVTDRAVVFFAAALSARGGALLAHIRNWSEPIGALFNARLLVEVGEVAASVATCASVRSTLAIVTRSLATGACRVWTLIQSLVAPFDALLLTCNHEWECGVTLETLESIVFATERTGFIARHTPIRRVPVPRKSVITLILAGTFRFGAHQIPRVV